MLSTLMHAYLMCSLASKRPVLSKLTPDSQLEGPMGLGRGEGTSSFPTHSQARALSTDRDGWARTPDSRLDCPEARTRSSREGRQRKGLVEKASSA